MIALFPVIDKLDQYIPVSVSIDVAAGTIPHTYSYTYDGKTYSTESSGIFRAHTVYVNSLDPSQTLDFSGITAMLIVAMLMPICAYIAYDTSLET